MSENEDADWDAWVVERDQDEWRAEADRLTAPAAEAGEMTEAGELRVRLQHVEHDLEHVVRERDREAAEAARLREIVARVEAALNGALMVPQAQVRRALDGSDV